MPLVWIETSLEDGRAGSTGSISKVIQVFIVAVDHKSQFIFAPLIRSVLWFIPLGMEGLLIEHIYGAWFPILYNTVIEDTLVMISSRELMAVG